MSFLRRFMERVTESDEERLRAEMRDWAATVPGVAPIGECPNRQRIRVAGVVRRITVWPREGDEPEYMEVVLDDGTGEIAASWTGRRSIAGMSLGTRLIVEGVLRDLPPPGRRTMDNPLFEFAR